jgi:ABC-type phosphate/phosphonate transport system substrate-binding protein
MIGAVAYSANAVPIWEGMREYFASTDVPIDFALYSNYERQVDALCAGHIDLAWNTNVAWIRTLRRTGGAARAVASRDTDLVFTTMFVGRKGSGFGSLDALRGKRVALGSRDSGQARILAVHFLDRAGLTLGDVVPVIFDSDVGKHGDTGRSDLDGLGAVVEGEADAAAVGVNTWQALLAGGDEAVRDLEVIWESEPYTHCNFTALEHQPVERLERWRSHLFAMSWDVPEHRHVLELEGLRQWVPTDLAGYDSLAAAMQAQGVAEHW